MPTDKRVDEYIVRSQDFAKPILGQLRALIHKVCPEATETLKWGMPWFEYKGTLFCGMAAFKQHCSFGFWKSSLMKDPKNVFSKEEKSGMGNFGRIGTLKDLPSAKILTEYLKEAIQLHEDGSMKSKKEIAKQALPVPAYFQKALNKNKAAKLVFENFAPSHRKEYIKWLEDAKTAATRERRLASSIVSIAEGKGKDWNYMQKKKTPSK